MVRTGRPGTNGNMAAVKCSRRRRGRCRLAIAVAVRSGFAQRGPGVGEIVADVEEPEPVAGEPAAGGAGGGFAEQRAAGDAPCGW